MTEQQKTLDSIADWLHSIATAAPMNDAAEAIRMRWPLREQHDGWPSEQERAAFRAKQQEAATRKPIGEVMKELNTVPMTAGDNLNAGDAVVIKGDGKAHRSKPEPDAAEKPVRKKSK